MIKLVAFDWNGTLLADTQTIVDATSIELRILYGKTIDIKKYRQEFIIPVRNFFINLGLDAKELNKNHKKSAAIFDREYEKRVWQCRTRAGTRKLLSTLSTKNIKSVIFSNHTTERIIQQTNRLKITKFFDSILANENIHDAYTIKGKENNLIDYIKKTRLRNSEVLIIGDTEEEIIIGRDMGAKTVAITNGHCSTTRLRTAKPDYLISNLLETKKIIETLNTV